MRISDWSSDVCSSDLGCGGRGTGAANQALKADPDVVLHAMGDVFEDKLKKSLENLTKIHGDKVKVKDKRRDRKSVVEGKSLPVRVDLGGRRIIKKKTIRRHIELKNTRTSHEKE